MFQPVIETTTVYYDPATGSSTTTKPGSAIESPGFQAPKLLGPPIRTMAGPGSTPAPIMGANFNIKKMLGSIPPVVLYGGIGLAVYYFFLKKGK